MREPEAGTKWNVRQASSLTVEQGDRDGCVIAPHLGQNCEVAVYALRAPALAAGLGANSSQGAERTPTDTDRITLPGVLYVRELHLC